MSVQGYVRGYGFDLAKLKLVNGACNQEWKFDPNQKTYGSATLGEYLTGYPASDSAYNTAEYAVDDRVRVFKSNINDHGDCVIYIPNQTLTVGMNPNDVHIYSEREAKQILYENVLKVLVAIKKHTGFHNFTTKQNVIDLVNTAENHEWTYAGQGGFW